MLLSCAYAPSYIWFGKEAQLPLFSKHTSEILPTNAHSFTDEELCKWAHGVVKPYASSHAHKSNNTHKSNHESTAASNSPSPLHVDQDFMYMAEKHFKEGPGCMVIERSGSISDQFWNTFCSGF